MLLKRFKNTQLYYCYYFLFNKIVCMQCLDGKQVLNNVSNSNL